MNTPIIDTSQFKIKLQMNVFEADVAYPSNAIMTVAVDSDGFSAVTDMDVDIKQLIRFTDDLTELYNTLKGVAKIQEPYDMQQFIEFSGDGKGHIYISGKLNSFGQNGSAQELKFENSIDQTSLPEFISNLSDVCCKYKT